MLILNQVTKDLPKELADTIKDFAFTTIVEKTKKNKKCVVNQISGELKKIMINNSQALAFSLKHKHTFVRKSNGIFCGFCDKCGNYTYSYCMTKCVCSCP